MSTSSRTGVYGLKRGVGSVQSVQSMQSVRDSSRPTRSASRAHHTIVSHDDAYLFALRVAFLNYLLQPRKKRKEYTSTPKPATRAHTAELLRDFGPSGSAGNLKLPHHFRRALEDRMTAVLQGTERLQGFNDAVLKRTFAEAFNAFTARDFQKAIDKDRKVEPLILIFYSNATKAQSRNKPQEDQSWKPLVDRHLAMFVRLLVSIIKTLGGDGSRVELIHRLQTLENKLLTNDQNLSLDASQGEQAFVEVEVPLSYNVKDMPLVQIVLGIFGVTASRAQMDLDQNLATWTEEAALKDFKAYHFRLSSNMAGTLRKHDFDVDEAFVEWKRQEMHQLASIFAEILSVRPDLKGSTSGNDKALPARPVSTYGEDQAYADLSKMLSSPDSDGFGLDQSLSLGSLSLSDSSSIRSVDEPNYVFIPPEPRAVYKVIAQYAMLHDLVVHADQQEHDFPLSHDSQVLLEELAIRWRIPQFSRSVVLVEIAVRLFLDQQLDHKQLHEALYFAKDPPPEQPKKLPAIQGYMTPLSDTEPSQWTLTDFAGHQQALKDLNEALLRDLYTLLLRCYEDNPPTIGVVMALLRSHVQDDPAFSQRPDEMAEYSNQLEIGLRQAAAHVYKEWLDRIIPSAQEEWNFGHVVKLGQTVVERSSKIRKRYQKNPTIMGVSPHKVLVETVFPNFEEDAQEFIKRVIEVAKIREEEVAFEDGFDLYKELVAIRKIHVEVLPGQPFAFHIEGLLDEFVWKWIANTEEMMTKMVTNAINVDKFQVRNSRPDGIVDDNDRHSESIMDTFKIFRQAVDQIRELGWGDRVHEARFMTKLAGAISAAIGHYCQTVEGLFTKEMERKTVQEQVAQQQKSVLQYYKDVVGSKERVEPYQFLPESFVKFNNIEYAMHELDELEKVMRVDEFAELLRKVDGPKLMAKRPQKYVFTIKIVEAEDLKAMDTNGLSDPYLVLCDDRGVRLAKTRIIKSSLNPRWDESLEITVTGAVNLIATIWDWDLIGDHDFVGRTSLKLDPLHFGDYLPREFWLDLDTQGRVLFRVSMEGEREDIQFYFGKAFRHLKRTERDMVRKITEKLNAHINETLSRETLGRLLGRGIMPSMATSFSSMASRFTKRQSTVPAPAPPAVAMDVTGALQPLFDYFDANFAIMKETLTDATMLAVMTRLWKEVLIAIENLLVPPLSDKPSTQKPLNQAELDVVYRWLELLFGFFNAKDHHSGEVLGVPADVLKSPKWHELASLNFFYTESTENLIRESERMAAANSQRAQQRQQQQMHSAQSNRLSAPPTFGATFGGAAGFGSLGTIRRGKSIMMSRNLGTMRKAKEEKRREAQADPSDDMILRILRMRPEAEKYLKERHRQRERQAAQQAAAMIVRQSFNQGFSGPAFGGALYGRNNLPQR